MPLISEKPAKNLSSIPIFCGWGWIRFVTNAYDPTACRRKGHAALADLVWGEIAN